MDISSHYIGDSGMFSISIHFSHCEEESAKRLCLRGSAYRATIIFLRDYIKKEFSIYSSTHYSGMESSSLSMPK